MYKVFSGVRRYRSALTKLCIAGIVDYLAFVFFAVGLEGWNSAEERQRVGEGGGKREGARRQTDRQRDGQTDRQIWVALVGVNARKLGQGPVSWRPTTVK